MNFQFKIIGTKMMRYQIINIADWGKIIWQLLRSVDKLNPALEYLRINISIN